MAHVINMTLMAYCLIAGGVYLLVVTLAHEWLGRKLDMAKGIPPAQREAWGPAAFVVGYVMEGLFFVAIPTLAYSFFTAVLPLAGIRTGLALALTGFVLGGVPAIMGLSLRVRLWMPHLLYFLLGLLLKLGGCLAIIGYLYSL
ncbi:MAG: hypothetical protein QUT27_04080 [candidate division Zixibacteria bacterium]|nr:hypothetical protein [candidate division Zixibacteria bacterium]HPC10862.1 hypothetical protein [candidate division Zixibacteria bacterium]